MIETLSLDYDLRIVYKKKKEKKLKWINVN